MGKRLCGEPELRAAGFSCCLAFLEWSFTKFRRWVGMIDCFLSVTCLFNTIPLVGRVVL